MESWHAVQNSAPVLKAGHLVFKAHDYASFVDVSRNV